MTGDDRGMESSAAKDAVLVSMWTAWIVTAGQKAVRRKIVVNCK